MYSVSFLNLPGSCGRHELSPGLSAWRTGALTPTMRPQLAAAMCSPRVDITNAGLQSNHSVQCLSGQKFRHARARPYFRQIAENKYLCEASLASLSLSQEGDAPNLEAWEQPPRSWENYPVGE